MTVPTFGDFLALCIVGWFFLMVIAVFGGAMLLLAARTAMEKGPPWLQRRIFYVRERISKRRVTP